MKHSSKAVIINLAITAALALLIGLNNSWRDFAALFGLAALGISLLNFLLAVFLFITRQKQAALGCLLSAGILLLVGFSSCSQMKIAV